MDVSALGNHEFDYGQEILQKRMLQAQLSFPVCKHGKKHSGFTLPEGKVVLEKDDFKIAFISVVETGSVDNKPFPIPRNLRDWSLGKG